ncbi:MAG: helix-turn-helix transcriptional regulator [Clostridiales bacterium]|jgi:transcriptional regulator with XRE-family HTH domain|nr:helix-turn-helix transcriptional regulator [Clostridiales bacterium]
MEQAIKGHPGLGGRVRQLRKERNLTQDKMVSRLQVLGCDLSRGTYAKIEAGIRHISIKELTAFTQILGVDFNTLFTDL